MNTFLFQSMPDRYDLRSKLVPSEKDTWYATRYRTEMHPDDTVFFWMGGDPHFRGLYGWGKIISEPYIRSDWDSHGVDVLYEVKFERAILAQSLREEDVLRDLLIFRAPQATNFLLSNEQVQGLIKVLKARGEVAPKALDDGG